MHTSIKGRVVAVSISHRKGTRKGNVPSAQLIANFGIEHDAHAGPWHRQVSLLPLEGIARMREVGADVAPGDFAENITAEGIDLSFVAVGDTIAIGEALLEVTQIGKECHAPCDIQRVTGACIMPREGVFARVLRGGLICPGDTLVVIKPSDLRSPDTVSVDQPEVK